MSLTTSAQLTVNSTLTPTSVSGLSTQINIPLVIRWANGTGSAQADLLYTSQRTLALSTSETLDLNGGSLLTPLGTAFAALKIKLLFIYAATTNVNDVVVGGAASNVWVGPFGSSTHTLAVPPGGWLVFPHPTTGWTVTPSTAMNLKVLNGGAGTSVIYDIVIVGTSV